MRTAIGIGAGIGFGGGSGLIKSDPSVVAFYDASRYNSDYDCILNDAIKTGDAEMGSSLYSSRARVYGGVGYLPGSGANYFSTIDSANNSPSDQFEVIMRVALPDWTPTSNGTLVGKFGAAGNKTFSIWSSTIGALNITASGDGTATTGYTSTASVSVADAAYLWIKVTFLSTDQNYINFYTAADTGSNTQPSSWTQLGAQVTGVALTLFDGTAPLAIGATNITNDRQLQMTYMSFSKTIGGAALQVLDTSAVPNYAYGWRSSTGEDWTVSVSAAYQMDWLYKVSPAMLGSAGFSTNARVWGGRAYIPGTSGNYFNTPHTASYVNDTDEHVAYVNPADWTPSTNGIIASKWTSSIVSEGTVYVAATTGYLGLYWYQGASKSALSTVATGFTDGTGAWVKVTRTKNGANQDVRFYTSREAPTTEIGSINWTQLGATVTIASGNPDANTGLTHIGFDNSTYFNGIIRRYVHKSTIDGTTVHDFDPANATDLATSFTSTDGRVYSVTKSTASDTNDPKRLVYSGEKYVYLPGIASNYISAPDAAYVDLTEDLDIVARWSFDNWTSVTITGGEGALVSKYQSTPTTRSYGLYILANGRFRLRISTTGSDGPSTDSSVATSFAAGATGWIRATRVKSTGVVTFYTAADQATVPTSWTQLGTTSVNSANVAMYVGTQPVYIGAAESAGTGNVVDGKCYYAEIRDTIGGSPVIKFDASLSGKTGYTDSLNSAVWTINRATAGKKTVFVTATCLLSGTDDQLLTKDHRLLNRDADFTVVGLFRQYATAASFARLIEKVTSNANNGYQIMNNGAALQLYAGYDGISTGNVGSLGAVYASGSKVMQGAVITGTLIYGAEGAGAYTSASGTAGSLMDTTSDLFIARPDLEFYGLAILRRALTATELSRLFVELGGNN